jgi:hypothetical protein
MRIVSLIDKCRSVVIEKILRQWYLWKKRGSPTADTT